VPVSSDPAGLVPSGGGTPVSSDPAGLVPRGAETAFEVMDELTEPPGVDPVVDENDHHIGRR
jgi:hypothetical protein